MADTTYTSMIYGALASGIDSVASNVSETGTYDYEAVSGRLQGKSLLDVLSSLTIEDNSIGFMNSNREFMKSLMDLNKRERDVTIDASGVDATGESNTVKNEYLANYEYVDGNNYYEDFARDVRKSQIVGDETTKYQSLSSGTYNYSGNHNDLYSVTENLFPDDEGKGTFYNKWIVDNKNSLLYKTRKLFNAKKINSIISRFHTNPSSMPSPLDNAKSKYGLSHGRNLLTKSNENGYSYNSINGYDNPYCRVWTHHHQYDRYYKTIRPFSYVDEYGNYDGTIGVGEFHQWDKFSDANDGNEKTVNKWGWKKDKNNGWQYSVLQDNGKVNITPKYDGGGSKNIHTKQCMFSIENLAWRGYDPYSFEQALSWEQRGPLGGRIMWFPPYGIKFHETTSARWDESTFLGRGESVYTYTNTTRTGTLHFMMVVDHPSILDYVTWTRENSDVTDTDILRFLAGCGEGDGDGLRDRAKPTPLTDEYTQVHDSDTATEEETPVEVPEEQPTPDEEPAIPSQLCFYVFYPNNYSGTYDDPWCGGGDGYNIDGSSKVEAIAYLLAGNGAQKSNDGYTTFKYANDNGFHGDATLNANAQELTGSGYQMGKGALGTSNYIIGTASYGNSQSESRYWKGLGANGTSRKIDYRGSTSRLWYYRIDGRYKYPQSTSEEKIHYYNQAFSDAASYKVTSDYGYNANIESLQAAFPNEIEKNDGDSSGDGSSTTYTYSSSETQVFTLSEMANVLYGGDFQETSTALAGSAEDDGRAESLKNILSQEVTKIEAVGGASSQGYVELNQKLAINRSKTAVHWFMHMMGLKSSEVQCVCSYETVSDRDNVNVGGSNSETSVKNRYARVTVTFKTTGTTTAAAANNTGVSEEEAAETSSSTDSGESGSQQENASNLNNNKGGKNYVGYSPTGETYTTSDGIKHDVYKDKDGKKWYLDTGEGKFYSISYASEETDTPSSRYDTSGSGSRDENRLRYDQEYHFFKVLQKTDPVVFDSLMDKLQYFDPAFHSMTPEGFNGRLTFLQQCMRQGNTVSASDGKFAKSASNLAFGRAPYCVLRLGDFYNQMIVITNLDIEYDPLVWDLNVEGAGVQPLIANVQLSFTFIGGGDMTGPVRRLQNAMSFNYYANARLYDNRADRIERKWSDKTNGAIEHDEILSEDDLKYTGSNGGTSQSVYAQGKTSEDVSTFYTPQMYQ